MNDPNIFCQKVVSLKKLEKYRELDLELKRKIYLHKLQDVWHKQLSRTVQPWYLSFAIICKSAPAK